METLWQDIRFGVRMLRKNPGFTAVAVLTLALGIGANTAIYSVVDAVLLSPLPYANSERLVYLLDKYPNNMIFIDSSYPEYLDWKAQTDIFDDLAAYTWRPSTITGQAEPERVWVVRSTANFLPLIAPPPFLGRYFNKESENPNSAPVAVLSYSFWQKRFGGENSVLGKPIRLDGRSRTIIGVMPPGMRNRLPSSFQPGVDVWEPLRLTPETSGRGQHFMFAIGALQEGITVAQAQQRANSIAAHMAEEGITEHIPQILSLQSWIAGGAQTPLLVLLGAAGFVLLLTCANIANLLLARSSARQKEVAIRMALGATRLRLVRQLVTEGLLLSLVGGCLGLLIAWWSVAGFAATQLSGLPNADQLGMDSTMLASALIVSLLTGLLFSLAPAFQTSRTELVQNLKEGGRQGSGTGSRTRLRSFLVAGEVAVTLMLLVGTGLLFRSFFALMHVDLGFNPDRLLSVSLSLPDARYPSPEQQQFFYDDVLNRISSLPGVESAALVNVTPLNNSFNSSFRISPATSSDSNQPLAASRLVSPGYFKTMGIPLLLGRPFDEKDSRASARVAIVTKEFARRFLPADNLLGQKVATSWSNDEFMEIVGVVGDVKAGRIEGQLQLGVYIPHKQTIRSSMTFMIRTASNPESIIPTVRKTILAVDKNQPVEAAGTVAQRVALLTANRRITLMLLGIFSGLALFLATLGLYGVLSHIVSYRTHEIGIRMALGASRPQILGNILSQGMRLVFVGLVVGLAGALALSRYLGSLLYSVSAFDPVTFFTVPIVVAAVASAACYLPARRATRVDPMVALRYE